MLRTTTKRRAWLAEKKGCLVIGITVRSLMVLFAATTIWSVALVLPSTAVGALTSAGSSSIGVEVDPIPTTQPPATQPPATQPPASPETTAPSAPPTTQAPTVNKTTPTTAPAMTDPADPPVPTTAVPEVSEFREAIPAPAFEDETLVEQVVSAAKTTSKTVRDILKGKPVADAIEAALSGSPAGALVVPAVRTASTFVFPIGLAGAVFAFLLLQQRIDAGDPKLTAAPLAHDDDVIEFL